MYSSWRSSPFYLLFLVALLIGSHFVRGHKHDSIETITKHNFDLIKIGMDQEAVDFILTGINEPLEGSGTCSIKGSKISIEDDEKSLEDAEVKWELGDKTIRIQFKDNKVVSKSQSGLN